MKNACFPRNYTLIQAAFLLVTITVAPHRAHAFQLSVPVAAMNDRQPDDEALETCLDAAIAASGTCQLPAGTLIITKYPAPLRQSTVSGIRSLNGATLRGVGTSTIVKGMSINGFDVLQLNAVANFNISDLSITSVTASARPTHGSNGISMTNGTNNIKISNVHVYALRYVQAKDYMDGGKAFTVQTGEFNKGVPMKNISVEKSSSRNVLTGFHLDADTNESAEPGNINVIGNSLEGDLAGVMFSFVAPIRPMTTFGATIRDNTIKGGKYGIALARGRSYQVTGNNVILRDSNGTDSPGEGFRFPHAGDFIDTRQTLFVADVPSITAELNTFRVSGSGGNFFLRKGSNGSAAIFRRNKYYGNAAKPPE